MTLKLSVFWTTEYDNFERAAKMEEDFAQRSSNELEDRLSAISCGPTSTFSGTKFHLFRELEYDEKLLTLF